MARVRKVTIIIIGLTLAAYVAVAWWYEIAEQRMESLVAGKDRPVPQQVDIDIPKPAAKGLHNYDIIATRNIFQAALKADDVASTQEDFDNLDETSLQLVLLGTVTGADSVARAIIIDEKSKKQNLYSIGDSVQGATITKISRGRVILDVRGESEVLTIRDRKGGGPSAPVASAQVTPAKPAVTTNVPVARPRRRISLRQPIKKEQPEEPSFEAVQEPQVPLSGEESDEPVETIQDANTQG